MFHAVKRAFDPHALLNPGKAVPTPRPLRGLRRAARARRPAAISTLAAVLKHHGARRHRRAHRAHRCSGRPARTPLNCAARDRRRSTGARCAVSLSGAAGTRRHRRLRSAGTGADGARRHAARRHRDRCCASAASICPSSRRISARRHSGRHDRLRPCGSGARRVGPVRDFVLGMRVLTGAGQVLQFGGRVMKNVAGYDVTRLMVGALGTLGVLLEISRQGTAASAGTS